ncbi:hypothetical protein ACH9L7_15905 [Haloferax sp. S1W]|uniref:hypothetical protein n=1 Tax=Haloferax sp. S1W TaxID=3377110 RepID=UPI0037CA0EC6
MSTNDSLGRDADGSGERADSDAAELRGEVEYLREENQRLRTEYLRARQATYRKSAVALLALGALSLLGSVVFPSVRTVLIVLAGTGGFAGVLLFYLTPDQLVPASVGEATYSAYATLGEQLQSELGLQDISVYTPLSNPDPSTAGVRLFVPQSTQWDHPDADALRALFVSPDDATRRGVGITPAATQLYREFSQSVTGELQTDPGELARRLADGVVEQFELAEAARTEVDGDDGRITVRVTDTSYGRPTTFDHPIVSFLGIGLADTLGTPAVLESVIPDGDEFVVTFRVEEDS